MLSHFDLAVVVFVPSLCEATGWLLGIVRYSGAKAVHLVAPKWLFFGILARELHNAKKPSSGWLRVNRDGIFLKKTHDHT